MVDTTILTVFLGFALLYRLSRTPEQARRFAAWPPRFFVGLWTLLAIGTLLGSIFDPSDLEVGIGVQIWSLGWQLGGVSAGILAMLTIWWLLLRAQRG